MIAYVVATSRLNIRFGGKIGSLANLASATVNARMRNSESDASKASLKFWLGSCSPITSTRKRNAMMAVLRRPAPRKSILPIFEGVFLFPFTGATAGDPVVFFNFDPTTTAARMVRGTWPKKDHLHPTYEIVSI